MHGSFGVDVSALDDPSTLFLAYQHAAANRTNRKTVTFRGWLAYRNLLDILHLYLGLWRLGYN
ncbi:MAG: hypothetical protein CTY20_09485 [Hyphomicrobium sp.]|nr:MAG: hypothetical protein CTY20_09485 [Hyphomicrobium sp.]